MAQTATITSYEYAAGTCTLRLVGELSPLSQVTGRPVLGRSRFTLQVRGDGQTPTTNQAVMFEASGREPQFAPLAALVQSYVQRHLNAPALGSGEVITQGASSLQPVGLTRHRLTLAADSGSPTTVDLSTLQLADLADALEQAEGSLQIVPEGALPKASRLARPRLSLWLGSVAAVGIAALLGNQFLTTAPGPVVFSPRESQTLNGAANGTAESAAPEERQLSVEEAAPDSEAPNSPATTAAPDPAAAGEALPAPTTTAPTTPAGSAATPQVAPQTPKTAPVPETRSPVAESTPAAPPQAAARAGARVTPPDSDTSVEQTPLADGGPAALSAPASPDPFDASPEIAATNAPATALDWIAALTRTLQQQWRPPANLVAPLRYRLTLEPDGTVEALEPLNDFSANYQNAPTLPRPGTTLLGVVSDDTVTVEVQFLPSGEVVIVPPEATSP